MAPAALELYVCLSNNDDGADDNEMMKHQAKKYAGWNLLQGELSVKVSYAYPMFMTYIWGSRPVV